jgi:hypothetical protein
MGSFCISIKTLRSSTDIYLFVGFGDDATLYSGNVQDWINPRLTSRQVILAGRLAEFVTLARTHRGCDDANHSFSVMNTFIRQGGRRIRIWDVIKIGCGAVHR